MGIAACKKPADTNRVRNENAVVVPDPDRFTNDVADAVVNSIPSMTVEELGDLRLLFRDSNTNYQHDYALGNYFDEVLEDPASREEVIAWIVQTIRDSLNVEQSKLDTSCLVPLVRSRKWWNDFQQEMGEFGESAEVQGLIEWLNDELLIAYAFDNESSFIFATPGDLLELGLERGALRELAVENLNRIIPGFEIHRDSHLVMISAGGFYESSLILLEDLWLQDNLDLPGDYVFAIPVRDVLVLTGSKDAEGVRRLRGVVEEFYTGEGRSVSPHLFNRKNGKFEIFADDLP